MDQSCETLTKDLAKGAAEILQNPRVATAVSQSTIAIWIGDAFDLIQWGAVGGCIGAVLSMVLIFGQLVRIRNDNIDKKIKSIQLALLEEERDRDKSNRLR